MPRKDLSRLISTNNLGCAYFRAKMGAGTRLLLFGRAETSSRLTTISLSVNERLRLVLALWHSIEGIEPGASEDWAALVTTAKHVMAQDADLMTENEELALATR